MKGTIPCVNVYLMVILMNRIITIGREFGSGGRELGRRLAEELQIEYWDKEIIEAISEKTSLSQEYVNQVLSGVPHNLYPITIGQSFYPMHSFYYNDQPNRVLEAKNEIIRSLAEKSSCVIVGRCADYILRDIKPYRIFVYADIESKVKRCMDRQGEKENLTPEQMKKKILSVDKKRAAYYKNYTGNKWGDKANYDLCINTTDAVIKDIVPHIAKML